MLSRREAVVIVADNETAVDLLYYEAIAKTVARLVRESSSEPLSVGVHGDWGAGKSSVLMMVEEAFKENERFLCVRFNGWLFQGFEDAKAVLIETIVKELLQRRSTHDRVLDQASKVLRRVDWMKFARKATAYGASLATGIPHPETLKDLGAAVHSVLGRSGEEPTIGESGSAIERSGRFREQRGDRAPEQMHAFREEFEELLERAGGGPARRARRRSRPLPT